MKSRVKTMTDLQQMLADAVARVKAMTPAEKAAMYQAQRESWLRGMTQGCEHGVLDFEQCPQCRSKPVDGQSDG